MKTLLLLVALGHGADAGSSLYAFHRGAVESNPLILSQSPAPFVAQMAGQAAAEMWILSRLSKDHPRAAKTLAWVTIGVRGSVAAHNVSVARGQR